MAGTVASFELRSSDSDELSNTSKKKRKNKSPAVETLGPVLVEKPSSVGAFGPVLVTKPPVCFDPTRVKGWHDMVHPQISAVVYPLKMELISKFGYRDSRCAIKVGQLLKIEDKTVAEHCPKCNITDKSGRRGLCWNFLCGRCDRGRKCKGVHARPDKLPQSVITELVALLTAPIAKKIEEIKSLPNIKKAKTGEAEVILG